MRRDCGGVTLIELLIFIAILGILASCVAGICGRVLDAQQRTAETLLAIETLNSQLSYLKALSNEQGLREGRDLPLPLDPVHFSSLPQPVGRMDIKPTNLREVLQIDLTLEWGNDQRRRKYELCSFLPRGDR